MEKQDVYDIKKEVAENLTDMIDNVNFGDWTDAKLMAAIESAADTLSQDEVVAKYLGAKLKDCKRTKGKAPFLSTGETSKVCRQFTECRT